MESSLAAAATAITPAETNVGSENVEQQQKQPQQEVLLFFEDEGVEVLHSQQPYGLASVRELLTFLISLLNLSDRHNTDTMRSMGLTIVNIALEVGGTSIKKFPSLVTLVRDDLAKHLFGIAAGRETKNPMVHTILTLFSLFFCVFVVSALVDDTHSCSSFPSL